MIVLGAALVCCANAGLPQACNLLATGMAPKKAEPEPEPEPEEEAPPEVGESAFIFADGSKYGTATPCTSTRCEYH